MIRRVLPWVLTGVATYLVFLVATLPADHVIQRVARQVPGLHVGPSEGTAWQGEARWVDLAGVRANNLQWDLSAMALFALDLEYDLEARVDGHPAQMTIAASPGGSVEIDDVRATLALAPIMDAAGYGSYNASGEIAVQLERVRVEDNRPVAARGRIILTDLQTEWLPDQPLGNFRGDIETRDGDIVATFNDAEGPMKVDGQFRLKPSGQWETTGTMAARNSGSQLATNLRFLGKPNSAGEHRFRLSGRL